MQCKIFVSVLVYDKSGMPLKQLNCTEFAGTSSVQTNAQVYRTDPTHAASIPHQIYHSSSMILINPLSLAVQRN